MARKLRQLERVDFSNDERERVVSRMEVLANAEDGWINLLPKITDDDERPTSLRFFTLFGGGGNGITMATWIPGSHDRTKQRNVGITHLTGRRAAAELDTLAVGIPKTWIVVQDHPRRGLVLSIPPDEPHEQVLGWALRAVDALSTRRPIANWRADIYLPLATS